MGDIRIGRISSVNYAAGTARVVYSDRDNAVTQEFPILGNTYEMPKVDDMVVVAHLTNAPSAGVILGKFWNGANVPPEGKRGIVRKDIDNSKCVIRYDSEDTTAKINCDGTIEISGKVSIEVQSAEINISGDTGDVVVNGISLVNHTHGSGPAPSKE